jgi:hypothetical protein
MGTPRILGNNVELSVSINGKDYNIGEVDKFSAKNNSEIKKSQAIGQKRATSNVVHMGWDLSFDGGKINWDLAQVLHQQDEQIVRGGRSPYFKIKQKVTYYDGQVETYEYQEVSLAGYEFDVPSSTEELTEKVSGFASYRKLLTDPEPGRASELSASISAALTAASAKARTGNL